MASPAPAHDPAPAAASERPQALRAALTLAAAAEYEILDELGAGGRATVFRARDRSLDRVVAIKVVGAAPSLDPAVAERFLLEARVAASLTHPHIAPVHLVRQSGDLLWFVMAYAGGPSLEQLVAAHGALPIEVVQYVVSRVGAALAYAHGRGVLHRDLGATNVVFTEDGTPLVTDFGIARPLGRDDADDARTAWSARSPEQCRGGAVTGATDQYALGLLTYHMLTGRAAFTGDDPEALAQAHLVDPPPSILDLRRDCPYLLASAVLRMLAKEPGIRWPTVEQAVSAVGLPDPRLEEWARLFIATTRPGAARDVAAAGAVRLVAEAPPAPVLPVRDEAPVFARLAIAPVHCTLVVGDVLQCAATPRDPKGAILPPRPVAWATSAPAVATVSARGLVTAHAPGEAIISATSEGKLAAATVVVTREAAADLPRPLQRPGDAWLEIAPSRASLAVGEQQPLLLRRRLPQSELVPMAEIRWASDDETVATVAPDGTLVAHDLGRCTVSARTRDGEATIRVHVTRVEVARLRLVPGNVMLAVGEHVEVIATALDRLGVRLPGRPIEWCALDAEVVRVTPAGRLEAVGIGQTEVLATCGTVTETVPVRVTPPIVASVQLEPQALLLAVGATQQLHAEAMAAGGRAIRSLPVVWESSDPTIATVDADGVVTGKRAGTVRVMVECGGRRAVGRVSVR